MSTQQQGVMSQRNTLVQGKVNSIAENTNLENKSHNRSNLKISNVMKGEEVLKRNPSDDNLEPRNREELRKVILVIATKKCVRFLNAYVMMERKPD